MSLGERHAMEINGIAHIQLTVNDLARAMPFYEEVLGFMGMKAVVKNPEFLYMIGGRSAVAIVAVRPRTATPCSISAASACTTSAFVLARARTSMQSTSFCAGGR